MEGLKNNIFKLSDTKLYKEKHSVLKSKDKQLFTSRNEILILITKWSILLALTHVSIHT